MNFRKPRWQLAGVPGVAGGRVAGVKRVATVGVRTGVAAMEPIGTVATVAGLEPLGKAIRLWRPFAWPHRALKEKNQRFRLHVAPW